MDGNLYSINEFTHLSQVKIRPLMDGNSKEIDIKLKDVVKIRPLMDGNAPDRTLYYEPQVKIRPLMDGNISLKLA